MKNQGPNTVDNETNGNMKTDPKKSEQSMKCYNAMEGEKYTKTKIEKRTLIGEPSTSARTT